MSSAASTPLDSPTGTAPVPPSTDAARLERALFEIKRVIVGQDRLVERMLVAVLARGHVLLEGVPGVAKTLAVETLARVVGGKFARLQFTPDLVPADIIGTRIYKAGQDAFDVELGPVFANFVLTDEVNRAPAKVQSALLEVMAEQQVSIGGVTHRLPDPFLVLATQNPIESEGVYPLPEAQRDRFLVHVAIGYPDEAQERAMLRLARRGLKPIGLDDVQPVADAEALRAAREEVDATEVSDEVVGYVVALVRRTRQLPSVHLGASPRAAVHLLAAAKAAARLAGRGYVTPDDVRRMAPPVLRHRLVLTTEAELERATPGGAIRAALEDVPVPR